MSHFSTLKPSLSVNSFRNTLNTILLHCRLRDISEKFSNCQKTRKFVITITVIMMVGACIISSLDILRLIMFSRRTGDVRSDGQESQDSYIIHSAQFLGYIWIISILSLSTFIKLHYLYKAEL